MWRDTEIASNRPAVKSLKEFHKIPFSIHMNVIALKRSCTSEDVPSIKRHRRISPSEDVQVIEKPKPPARGSAGPDVTIGDEDLVITQLIGPVCPRALLFCLSVP